MKKYYCDRCGKELKFKYERSKLRLRQTGRYGMEIVEGFHLCDDCVRGLAVWLNMRGVQ